MKTKNKSIMKKITAFLCVLMLIAGLIPAYPAVAEKISNKIIVIHTSNLRGNIDMLPGIRALKNKYIEEYEHVILVDSGNFLQGTKYSSYDLGKSYIKFMREAGYDIVVPGKFDMQFGDGTVGNAKHGDAEDFGDLGAICYENDLILLGTNITGTGAPNYFDQIKEYHSYYANGCDVAFYSYVDPDLNDFTHFDGVEAGSLFDVDQAAKSDPADVKIVFGNSIGHDSNDYSQDGNVYYCNITSNANADFSAGVYEIDTETKDVSHIELENENITYEYDDTLFIKNYKETVDEAYPFSTKNEIDFSTTKKDVRSRETLLGDFWCDALKGFATECDITSYFSEDAIDAGNDYIACATEDVVSVWNGGNLRGNLCNGEIIDKDLKRVLPYPNKVAICYLKGSQLVELLESATQNIMMEGDTDPAFLQVSGINYTLEAFKAYNSGEVYNDSNYSYANSLRRVTINSINGQDFDPDKTYAVITSNAIANGMDSNYIMNDKDEKSTVLNILVRDAIAEYMKTCLYDEVRFDNWTGYEADNARIMIIYEGEDTEPLPTTTPTKKPSSLPTAGPNTGVVPLPTIAPTVTPTPVATPASVTKEPSSVKIKSLKCKGKKVTIIWKNVSDADGYEVSLKSGKKFKKLGTVKNKGKKTVYKVSKKFKKGSSKVFAVRSFIENSGEKIFSKYVKTKKVKIK